MNALAALVVTTIYDLSFLEDYLQNFKKYGHLDQVQVIVIPDRKTPSRVYIQSQEFQKRGLRICCPSLEEQETFLAKVGFSPHLIPYDSDNRRNVGYLMALEFGADFVISIDDDNYCLQSNDFFQEHAVVCQSHTDVQVIHTSDGWFNFCSLLKMDKNETPYPRGFPYFARHRARQITTKVEPVMVHINTGLWLKEPDLDGLTWLVLPTRSEEFMGTSLVLSRSTWSPINTQNTSVRREAVAAYYFVKMGYPLPGMPPIDRYGDIFSGYFVQACAKHLGYGIRVGTPLVEHRRNTHNYLQDATKELACILMLEELLPWVTEVRLDGSDYTETYVSLSYALEEIVERMKSSIWSDAAKGYFHQMAYYMRLWAWTAARLL